MVLVLPEIESFGTQFAKALGSSVGGGIGNTPNLLMDLLKQKRERQAQSGQMAIDLASKVDPELGLEDMAEIFRKGSQLQKPNQNPAEIFEEQVKDAIERKNKLSRLKENIDPERSWKKFTDLFTGESSEDRLMKGKKLQKQLSGFSKTKQRQLLSNKLGAEEIEEKVSPLSKEAVSFITSFPDLRPEGLKQKLKNVKSGKGFFSESLEGQPLNENQKEYLTKHLVELFQKHPDANPLLIRKQLEDKGIGWRDYRDILENLQDSGQIDLSSNPDYPYLENYLQKPPMAPLMKALANLKLVGR